MNLEYPRYDNQKYYTDKYLIHILSNQLFYEKIFSSIDKALQYFNQCKEYFFVFDLPFGQAFLFKNTIYKRGNKRRTRFECLNTANQKVYLFNQNVEVEIV